MLPNQHKRFPAPAIGQQRYWAGRTIGILGGSFNPVHKGHLHISQQALNMLPIDCLWWMFTPGNPFKKHIKIAPMKERIIAAQEHIKNPRIILSDFEKQLGINRTYELCAALNSHFPLTRFIWVGGVDIAEEFHKWEHPETILDSMPMAFFRRPPFKGAIKKIPLCTMAQITHHYTMPKSPLSYKPRNVYWHLKGPAVIKSSTQIRKNNADAQM